MAEQKTKATGASVDEFIGGIADEGRREDCKTLVKLMKKATGAKPAMWGPSIVGFGSYHYKYASGHEGDSCLVGFAPRKNELSIYIMSGFDGHAALLKKLGKHKTAKACLYVKKLDDVDLGVLEELVRRSVAHVKTKH
ncbi:MAG TPA: DUF1801 domain-containing protein [Candidatus Polarisedimenticolaceae bacterium]|nr:DUF1801 domain-containing protein [Candidatus Polarisedimenticolaceae bacterium]